MFVIFRNNKKTAYTFLNKQQKLLCIRNYKHFFFSKIIIRNSSIAVLGSIGFQNRFEKKICENMYTCLQHDIVPGT